MYVVSLQSLLTSFFALVHALCFLSCPCLCKVCSLVSDALLVVFRHFNTHGIVTQVTLCFSPSSKHMFTLSGTDPTAFTLWRGLPRRLKMAAYTPHMRVFRRVKMATTYDSHTMQEVLWLCNGALSEKTAQNF